MLVPFLFCGIVVKVLAQFHKTANLPLLRRCETLEYMISELQ